MTANPLGGALPPAGGRGRAWLSAHLFLPSPDAAAADRVILELVAPLVEGAMAARLLRRFFFIRYADGGAHLRLRLLGPRERLEPRIGPALERWAETRQIERLRWVPYEPEVARYGGPAGVRLAERLFFVSSQAAIALLRRSARQDRDALVGRALLAMQVLLFTLGGSRRLAAELARGYHAGAAGGPPSRWLPADRFEQSFARQAATLTAYVEKTWHLLALGLPLTPELDRYRADLAPFAPRLRRLFDRGALFRGTPAVAGFEDCLASLLPSYLHLMNNRLGIGLAEETYLAGLLWRSDQRAAAVSPG
jgi:thiopeptide-type bacteriocin biosynthesis protein